MKDAILCDLECLANDNHRRPLLIKGETDQYHRQCVADKVFESTAALLKACRASDYLLYFVSDRPIEYEHETIQWLSKNNLAWWRLILGMGKTSLSYHDEKVALVHSLKIVDRIAFVIESSERSIRTWRALRIPCFVCTEVYYA